MAKDRRSPYVPGKRTDRWQKVKIRPEQELVVGGWAKGTGRAVDLGALLVGVYEGGGLRYAGKIGAGFTDGSRAELLAAVASSPRTRRRSRSRCRGPPPGTPTGSAPSSSSAPSSPAGPATASSARPRTRASSPRRTRARSSASARGPEPTVATTYPLRALADLAPVLEAPDADFGHWFTPPPKDGVLSMGWYEFGPAGEAFQAAAGGWIVPGFDWRGWLETEEGSGLRKPEAVAAATPGRWRCC